MTYMLPLMQQSKFGFVSNIVSDFSKEIYVYTVSSTRHHKGDTAKSDGILFC